MAHFGKCLISAIIIALPQLQAAEPHRPGEATLVTAGDPVGVSAEPQAWDQIDGALVGRGVGSLLSSRFSIGTGDFVLLTRLSIDALERTAAALMIGSSSHFGLDGGTEGSHFFTEGELFGGVVTIRDASSEHLISGTPFTFELSRRGSKVTVAINQNVVEEFEYSGAIGVTAWRPHRGTLRIKDWKLRGNLRLLPAPQPAGYTIPIIDLSDETTRQTVVDRDPEQYLGHPTTVLLADGQTIVVVYPEGHGRGPIVMKRSVDGGVTWSDRLPTPDNWSTSKETPTIYRVQDSNGGERLLLFSGLHPIRRSISEDQGMTWTPLEPVGDWGGIVAMASVAALGNGTLAAWFHDDGRFFRSEPGPRRFDVYQSISSDGGVSWEEPRSIATLADVDLCEPGFIRSPDGSTIVLLMRENRRRRNSFMIRSEDEGKTWSRPIELPAALTGDRHTAVHTPDGRLFISFRDTTRDSQTQGDWVAWVGTWDDLVSGREGQYRIRLMDNHHRWDCAYPGVLILADGTIVTTTYGHWTVGAPPYVVSIRLQLSELDRRASER